MWLVEPSTFIGAGERHIAERAQGVGVPVILIINKIDTVKKRKSFRQSIRTARSVILPRLSLALQQALRGQNTEDIIDKYFEISSHGIPCSMMRDTVTDQPLSADRGRGGIREKALHALDAEIPHGIA